jgi:hypothetical protein
MLFGLPSRTDDDVRTRALAASRLNVLTFCRARDYWVTARSSRDKRYQPIPSARVRADVEVGFTWMTKPTRNSVTWLHRGTLRHPAHPRTLVAGCHRWRVTVITSHHAAPGLVFSNTAVAREESTRSGPSRTREADDQSAGLPRPRMGDGDQTHVVPVFQRAGQRVTDCPELVCDSRVTVWRLRDAQLHRLPCFLPRPAAADEPTIWRGTG